MKEKFFCRFIRNNEWIEVWSVDFDDKKLWCYSRICIDLDGKRLPSYKDYSVGKWNFKSENEAIFEASKALAESFLKF